MQGCIDGRKHEVTLPWSGDPIFNTHTSQSIFFFVSIFSPGRLLDADGTETLDIDEFTSAMMRLMTDGPDEVTLERARRQALTKAFEEADADESGSLDAAEIMELLKNSDPLRTHSELDRQVCVPRYTQHYERIMYLKCMVCR